RNREVVQQRQGLRVYHAGRWRKGRLRPPQRDQRRGVQEPRRRGESGVRRRGWSEGPAGTHRQRRRLGLTLAGRTAVGCAPSSGTRRYVAEKEEKTRRFPSCRRRQAERRM